MPLNCIGYANDLSQPGLAIGQWTGTVLEGYPIIQRRGEVGEG